MMNRYFLLSLVLCLSFTGNTYAQETAPAAAPITASTTNAFIPAEEQPAAVAPTADKPSSGLLNSTTGGDSVDITADQSLEWHEEDRVYIARGRAKAKRGDVLVEADILKAFDRKKPDGSSEIWRMEAMGNVKVSSKTQTATGSSADYNIDTRKAILKGDNLRFTTDKDVVTAKDSLEFWENENVALAKGDATAIRDGRQVKANELRTYFSKNSKGETVTERMEAKKNVYIVTDKDVILCDEAVYFVSANTATLSGNVFITQGKNQLKGDKAESNFKTGISRMINAGSGRVHALISAADGKNNLSAKKNGSKP